MNVYRLAADGTAEAVSSVDAEFAFPDWIFGYSSYDFDDDGSIVGVGRSRGRDRLYRLDCRQRRPGDPGRVLGDQLPQRRSRRRRVPSRLADPAMGRPRARPARQASCARLREGTPATFDPADMSVSRLVEFPTTGGKTAFGLFYPPHNRSFQGPAGEQPPLVVTSHGGPTAQASTAFSILAQLFTSRGFAVLDVDYGGSTGYGKDYRKRLEGEWGVVDVDDCVGRRPLGRRRRPRRRRAARDPRRQRERLHDALRRHVQRRVQRRGELLRDRRPRDIHRPDPQVRVALPRPARRAVPGAEGPLP